MAAIPTDFSALTAYLRDWLAAVPSPGLAISVTDRQKTLYSASLGYGDAAARRPARADTTFQIGSIGKSMTALALMQLVQAGRLDLDAPLSTHLPWFAMPSRHGPIALKHMLSHTAGLPAGTDFTPAARYEGYALREAEAAWEPGSRFHYSNTGYKLLGWLLEDVTGLPYGEVIRRRVLEPLGMAATDPALTHSSRRQMATGYVPLHDDRPYRRGDPLVPGDWSEYAVGDGSQASTAEDMARYARLWLNDGRSGIHAIVSPASFARMTAAAIDMRRGGDYQHDYGYGFGVIRHHADGHRFIGHGGGTVGFRSIMLTDQTDGLGVVILCNGVGVDTYPPARYALQVAAALRDKQPMPEPPEVPDPRRIVNADRYAGAYLGTVSGRRLFIQTSGKGLHLDAGTYGCHLEHIAGDAFCAPHDAFDPFPLRFRSAATDDDGPVFEVHHGPDVYVRAGSEPQDATAPHPQEWSAFPGQYRSHAPYLTTFRVILRRGRLRLAWPHGGEEELVPQNPDGELSGWFKIGPVGEPSAERLRFDTVVGNRALRIRWTGGGDFYRVD